LGINLRIRVGVEWVNKFHHGPCYQNDLDYCDDQAVGFLNEMGSHGHAKVFNWGNDNAWETDFRDSGSGGDSLNWSDDVHFCFFDDHGGNWDSVLHLAFSKSHDRCLASSSDMRLGTKNLKWISFCGCETVLNTEASHILAVWGGPMRGVHLVLGFIGDSHDTWWTADLGEDFAGDICGGDAIGGAWIDRAYSWWAGDDSFAVAAGTTQADAINRRDHETLNWRDLDVAGTFWLAWKWRR